MKNRRVTTWTGGGGSLLNRSHELWLCSRVKKLIVKRLKGLTKSERQSLLDNGLMRSRTTLVVSKDEKKGNTRASARIKVLFTYCPIALLPRKLAFTMAEILLSLTIIGVVAAITLPSLTGNINERTWNTQRKALYARFSQAISLMPALNGYGTLTTDVSGSVTADTAAETFVTEGLSKVLKINNICDSEHLQDCGIPSAVTNISGSQVFSSFPKTLLAYNPAFNYSCQNEGEELVYGSGYSQIDTKAAAFETANGESMVVFYNPNCRAAGLENLEKDFIQPKMCANFIYDLNGTKGPNTVGKDIGFITALYSSDPVVVAPLPVVNREAHITWADAGRTCRERDSESRLPNMDELAAVFYNRDLMGIAEGDFWSSSLASSRKAYIQDTQAGFRFVTGVAEPHSVWCVKR